MYSLRLTSLALVMALAGCSTASLIPGAGGSGSDRVAPPPTSDSVTMTGNESDPLAAEVSSVPVAAREDYARAVLLMETGDQVGARAELERFSASYPSYPQPFVNLAIIDIAEGRLEDAVASLNKALQIKSDFAPALNQLGILHRKKGEFDQAEAAYLKAITVNPDYALAHLNLGILNDLYLGRLDQALTAYESYQALTIEEDPEVARWIADLTRRTSR